MTTLISSAVNRGCRTRGCVASPKADHRSLHAAAVEQLAATPIAWASYPDMQAELVRRGVL